MLSKKIIKQISKLSQKKYRDQLNLFVAEGGKLVTELLDEGMEADTLIYSSEWEHQKKTIYISGANQAIETDCHHIKKISNLKTPPLVVGVFKIPKNKLDTQKIEKSLSLLLDDLQDPGNMGTIIRIADWFGIKNIFCSPNTVDQYNPKVIQASMGAISRVNIFYTPLNELIEKFHSKKFPIYGAFLEGEIIYNCDLTPQGFIVIGNEGKGISSDLESFIDTKLYIPSYPDGQSTSESLNVSAATAIICAEFRRRLL